MGVPGTGSGRAAKPGCTLAPRRLVRRGRDGAWPETPRVVNSQDSVVCSVSNASEGRARLGCGLRSRLRRRSTAAGMTSGRGSTRSCPSRTRSRAPSSGAHPTLRSTPSSPCRASSPSPSSSRVSSSPASSPTSCVPPPRVPRVRRPLLSSPLDCGVCIATVGADPDRLRGTARAVARGAALCVADPPHARVLHHRRDPAPTEPGQDRVRGTPLRGPRGRP